MTIQVGDRLPDTTFMTPGDNGPEPRSTSDIFAGKKVALFSVPGAFTPTCSARHLPGFADASETFHTKGIDTVACTSVNDAFVLGAWAKQSGTGDKVVMLADGNGDFARAIGLEMDGTKFGLGKRGERWSMLVDDGVVKQLNVEQPGAFEVSSAERLLSQLN